MMQQSTNQGPGTPSGGHGGRLNPHFRAFDLEGEDEREQVDLSPVWFTLFVAVVLLPILLLLLTQNFD